MNLHKARDAGVVTACICGGKAQAPAHVPRLTPRLWLERRWKQQHEASRRSAAPTAAASSTLDVPADQDAASGHETLVQPWSEVVVLDHEQVLQQHRASRLLQPVPPEFSRPAWPQHQQQLQPHLEQPEEQLVEQARLRLLRHQLSTDDPVCSAKVDSCRRQISAKAGSSSQQLMQAIKAARKVHQLEQIYRQSRQDMDMLHCSSMLNRLAHLYQRQSAIRQQQQLQEQAPVNRPIDIAAETAQALAHTLQAAHRPQSTTMYHLGTQYHTDKQAQQHYSLLEQQQQHAQVPAAEADPQQHSIRSRSPRAVKQQCHSKAGRVLSCLLHEFVNSHITAAGTRQLSSTLWVMAKCSRLLPDKLMLQQTAAALLSQLLSPGPVAALAANTAALSGLPSAASEYVTSSVLSSPQSAGGVDQPGCQQQLRRRCVRHRLQASGPLHHQQQQCTLLHTGSSIDVANTVWAVGRLSQVVGLDKLFPGDDSVPTILRTLEQLCCYHLLTQRPDAVFISSCMCGFALMNHQVHHLFAAVVHRAGDRYVKAFQSQQLLTVCWSLAKLGHYDQQLFTKLMWRAVVVRKALLPQHVSLLLWAAGRVGHKGIDPRAVSQLLQVWKQPDSSSSSSSTIFAAVRGQHVANLLYGLMQLGQLQQQRGWVLTWLLQVVMQKLDDLQPAGIAVVLTALLQLTQGTAEHVTALTAAAVDAKNPVPAGVAQLKTGDHQQQLDSTAAVAPQASQPKHQSISSSLGSQQQVLSSVSQYPSRQLGVWSSSYVAHSHQLVPLYRELSRRITAQISNTRPHTLYQTTVALARAGYYDARLYTKLAAAAAAAAVDARPADVLSADGVPSQPTYSMHQQLQLVCVFAHYQYPVPALWSAVLPSLTTAAVSELSPQHLVMLVSASRFSGCEQQQTDVVEGLLHLTSEALEQQSDLSVTQLVQLAATGSWWLQTAAQHLCYDEDQEQASSSSNMKKRRLSDLISDIERHLHRLVPRLVSVVLSKPHVAAMQHVPLLLEAAVTLQSSKDGRSGIAAAASTVGDGDDSASVCSSRVRSPSQHVVGPGQLQRLANTAVEHLCHWRPSALVMLLSCHTQAVLFDPLLADAYAEELLARIEQCSVQSLVQLLSVLAGSSKGQQSYCHSQLTATAARQLHGKLLLACDVQLQAAVTALRQLGQEDSPACRAAARLLMHGSNSS